MSDRRKLPENPTVEDELRPVIAWAERSGYVEIAATLRRVLYKWPGDVERLLASNPADHEEGRRIAWLHERLSR